MADTSLDTLITRASVRRMTPRERREQGISFVVGNIAIEGISLHRGTVTLAVPGTMPVSAATESAATGLELPTIPFDVQGSVRQFDLVRKLVEDHLAGTQIQITPQLIKMIHAEAGNDSNHHFGVFRHQEVAVQGSLHKPPLPHELEGAITAFCAHLNVRWAEDDALSLSAYALWRLNWIHPFIDGNGRAARALSYLILNLKLGTWLPGVPTLPEQLNERREEYFDALIAADLEVRDGVEPTLLVLRSLLEELLLRQLRSLPAQSGREETQLADIVARRIDLLHPMSRDRIFGSAEVEFRAWSIGDYLLVHVASKDALAMAEALFAETSQPFPGLLAAPGEHAVVVLTREQRGAIVRPRTFEVGDGAALRLHPNAAAIVERPTVSLRRPGVRPFWTLGGALYILRRGDEITNLWTNDVLDVLVARHVQGAG